MESTQTWRRQWNMRRWSVGRSGTIRCWIMWREKCGMRLNKGVSQMSSCVNLRSRISLRVVCETDSCCAMHRPTFSLWLMFAVACCNYKRTACNFSAVTGTSGASNGKFGKENAGNCACNKFVELVWREASPDGSWSVAETGTKKPERVSEACACEGLLLGIVSPPSDISLRLTGVLEEIVVTVAWVVTVVNDVWKWKWYTIQYKSSKEIFLVYCYVSSKVVLG